jgi:saccharopine dehydrogenase (NAD+, L-lysine-forming)
MLAREHGVEVVVQPSPSRAFTGAEFREMGAAVQDDLSACPVIFGIKEMPEEFFEPDKTYVFFAHVIKGQPYNMPMLRRLLDLGCTLIDYERVVDERNRRLIFFGWHAGVAGAIDTLWALGQRLAGEGCPNPFALLRQTYTYHDLAEARAAFGLVREQIETRGLPGQLSPLIVGVAGYGNVSHGVQEMLSLLPVIDIQPGQVATIARSSGASSHHIYQVVFKEWDMVEPLSDASPFELQDYYEHPEKYRGVFEQHLPHLTVLFNAIFWTSAYPRLVTKSGLARLFASTQQPRLRIIGDISCDIEGAIECTVKSTHPDHPVFVYDPISGAITDGLSDPGVLVLAVDILPAELPRESSTDFGRILRPFIPAIARCDYSVPFDQCDLPPEIKRAVVAYRGELTPDYQYIAQYLK